MREMTKTGVEDGVGVGCEFALFGDDGFFGVGGLNGGGNGRRGECWVDDERLDDFTSKVSDCSGVGLDVWWSMKKWR